MENQLPLYLTQHLESIGVLESPYLSQQEELIDPRELWNNLAGLDDDGEPTF